MYVHVHARRGMRAHRSLLNGHQEADQEGQLAGPVGGQGLYHCFVGETEWVSLLGSRDYGNKSIHINRESGGKGRLSAGCLVGQQCVCVCFCVRLGVGELQEISTCRAALDHYAKTITGCSK